MLTDQKHHVIQTISSDTYYKSRFPRWNPRVKANVKCVFHKGDESPSLSINLRNGGAKCFAASCGASIGNIVHFEAARLKAEGWDKVAPEDEEAAARTLYSEFIRPIVPVATLQQFRENLKLDE